MCMKKHRIAILLPYKDHFTHLKAGSASIWVKDFNKNTTYKNQITIFGNANNLNNLIDKKNYINLPVSELNFAGKNASYVDEFIKHYHKNKFRLIEVHNRPSYIHQILKNNVKSNLVLIFHNNPLSLGGSKTLKERDGLLNTCEKLIFVSHWVKEKFFEKFEKKNHPKCEIIYPSINRLKKFPKKSNVISFVGSLPK